MHFFQSKNLLSVLDDVLSTSISLPPVSEGTGNTTENCDSPCMHNGYIFTATHPEPGCAVRVDFSAWGLYKGTSPGVFRAMDDIQAA